MARVDSLLQLMVQQRGTELRLGTDAEPQLFQHTTRLRLTMAPMRDETLRFLLGELLTPNREALLREGRPTSFGYDVPDLGRFTVTILPRRVEGAAQAALPFDVKFVLEGASASAVVAEPIVTTRTPDPERHAPAPAVSNTEPTNASNEALFALVGRAHAMRASDLHLMSGDAPHVRVDGVIERLDAAAVDVDALFRELLTDDERARFTRGQAIERSFTLEGSIRIRSHLFRASGRSAASIRILRMHAASLDSLNMPIPLGDIAMLPHGLVLVCGPSGAGKSTTLAALAQETLRRRSALLVSIEDPIEFTLHAPSQGSLVRQRQVGTDVPDFTTGLRDALREDPDVILIGEMRDPEAIALALTAAETGHLVFATLHARSAAASIERIVDAYPPGRQQQIRVQLADSLRAVVAQRLLPRASGDGRVPAIEVLHVTHAVSSLIREAKTGQIQGTLQSGRSEGMLPLERCLADLVRSGTIRLEDARAAVPDSEALAMYLAESTKHAGRAPSK